MSYEFILDSSVWIEYFIGNIKIEKIKEVIEEGNIATSILAIVELADKFNRDGKDFESYLNFIKSHAVILPITISIALESAKIKKKFRVKNSKFGIADSIHLATAHSENTKLLTKDSDFSDADNAYLI